MKSSLALGALKECCPNIASEFWRFYECFTHSFNSWVLVLHAINWTEGAYLMTMRLWPRCSACSGDPERAGRPAFSLSPQSHTFLGIPLFKFFGCLVLPVPILTPKKVPIKLLHAEVSLDIKRQGLEKVMSNKTDWLSVGVILVLCCLDGKSIFLLRGPHFPIRCLCVN